MPSQKKQVILRTEDEQHARWTEAAKKEGISLAAWLAKAANARLEKGGELKLGSEIPQPPSQFPRPEMQEIGKPAPPHRRPAQTGQLDLKKVDQPLCPHRVPLSAYCPRCR